MILMFFVELPLGMLIRFAYRPLYRNNSDTIKPIAGGWDKGVYTFPKVPVV